MAGGLGWLPPLLQQAGIHTLNSLVTQCRLQELEEIVLPRKLEQAERQKLQSLGVL